MRQMCSMLFSVAAALTLTVFCGCKTEEDFRLERAEKAMKHFERSRFKQPADGKRLSLKECIVLAQKHNLALKVEIFLCVFENAATYNDRIGISTELHVKYCHISLA